MFWCAVIAASCVTISLLAHPGIPAYRHDWQWPVDPASFGSWFWSKLDAWNWQGFGQPNIAIQVHPFFAISFLAAKVFPSKLLLMAWLAAASAVAAAGTGAFVITRFAVRPFPAIVTGVLYGLSPLVVNKMVAGHVTYLLGYAVVPWLVMALTSRHRTAPWAIGLSLAWVGLQFQVLVFGVVLALIVAARRLSFRNLFPIALAAGCMAPYAWALLRPSVAHVTNIMRTSIPWEVAQSVTLSKALLGVGYYAGYWENVSATVFGTVLLPWLYPAGVVLALALRRNPTTWALAVCYVLGVMLVSGLKGPLEGPLYWLFGHVAGASAFRELYDATIFLAFAGAAGAGIALNAMPNRNIQTAAAVVVIIVTAAPWLSGHVMSQTGSAFFTPAVERAVGQIAETNRPSRFYVAPGANPVGPYALRTGGADPAAFGVKHVAPFWAYLVEGHEGAVIWAIQRGGPDANVIAKAIGISAMLAQPNLTTKFGDISISGKNLHIQEFSGALERIPGWSPASKIPNYVLVPSGARPSVLRLIPEGLESVDAQTVQDDVQVSGGIHGLPIEAGWVPARDWWFLSDRIAQAAPHGVVTAARDAPMPIQCSDGIPVVNIYATGEGRVGRVVLTLGHWRKLRISCADNIRVSSSKNGYVVVTSGADLAAWRSIVMLGRLPNAPLEVTQNGDELVATVTADCRQCTIVLSETASPGWLMSIGGENLPAAALPSGFSAWRVDLSKGQIIRVKYAPARYATILEWCAAAAWVLLFGGLVCSFIRWAGSSSHSSPTAGAGL